ncbi:MAG: hypothetical protein ACI82A_003789 [Candidatus Azotimanducaceae bacterium]|jgi:hypothetical protein
MSSQIYYLKSIESKVQLSPNRSLQRTFDLPPVFATAKTEFASNAAELRRYVPATNLIWTG